jgi:hypothetical protein
VPIQPVIRATRVLVRVVLGYLAHGETTEHILVEFPSLAEEDVRAVIAFAAASAGEDLPAPSPIISVPRRRKPFSVTRQSISLRPMPQSPMSCAIARASTST